MSIRKIAIKTLAILQTCDLSAILRYRRIFAPHRIGKHTPRRKNALCLVWQATCRFSQKSNAIFGSIIPLQRGLFYVNFMLISEYALFIKKGGYLGCGFVFFFLLLTPNS